MSASNNYLFNFCASYSGGGYKRLYEYIKKFDSIGGANFIIHPRCNFLIDEFPNNHYYVVNQPAFERILNDCKYLETIVKNKTFDLYYAYGMPIYSQVARINWTHLSNVLPIAPTGIPMSILDHIKMRFLGGRIRKNLGNADVISAESRYSLGLIEPQFEEKLFLSVNGSDDEIAFAMGNRHCVKSNIAVVLGTYRYKALADSFKVFEMLRLNYCNELKLLIIGYPQHIPSYIASNENVIVMGVLDRVAVMKCLREAKYYISTTYIENSYNAASEGIFFAEESYISDIGPHWELLHGLTYDKVSIKGVSRPILHIENSNVNPGNIKSWDAIIDEMINKTNSLLRT